LTSVGTGIEAELEALPERKGVIFKDFTSSTALLPSRLTADTTVVYQLRTRTSVRLNVKNLFDERYYLNGAGTNVAYPAPPRTVQLSIVSGF
jgi:outer membrane receptor protein involved in Fe transport